MTDNEPLVKEIYIDASPDLVFSFLSERDKMLRWTGLTLDVDPQPGGVFCLNPNSSEAVRGAYLELIRPRRIAFTWGWDDGSVGVPPGSTIVEIDLIAKGDGTLVRLTHRHLPGGDVRPMHDAGWNQMLERLRIVAEGGDPGPNPGCPTDKHKVVSEPEWLEAREKLLVKEKKLLRLQEELSLERRGLPWVEVTKDYVFEGPNGRQTLADLFEGRSQLLIYQFMFGPDDKQGCPHCSLRADCFNGINVHLNQRDVTMICVSRAPYDKLAAYKKRMGWNFTWVSSGDTDFNFDYHFSFTPEQIAEGKAFFNYKFQNPGHTEREGHSVFYKDKRGQIFHTYASYSRGNEPFNLHYHYLDVVPKGRDEDGRGPFWVRRHDEYRQ